MRPHGATVFHMEATTDPDTRLGALVLERRKARGMTHEQLADAAGIPSATLSRRINAGGWKLTEMVRIASVLDIRLSTLIRKSEAAA